MLDRLGAGAVGHTCQHHVRGGHSPGGKHRGSGLRPRQRPFALVTAERLNEVVAVPLPTGRVLRRVHGAAGPTTVAAGRNIPAVVVSPGSGRVTLLVVPTLQPIAHDVAFAPDGRTVWVTSAIAPFVSVLDAPTGTTVARVRQGT